MAVPLFEHDSEDWWPRAYTWKLVVISAAIGIAAVIVLIAAISVVADGEIDGPHSGGVFLLLLIALLLWGAAVTGQAVRKGWSWFASLRAGLVALFVALGTWFLVAVTLLFIAVSSWLPVVP
jgi:hypothetical protein